MSASPEPRDASTRFARSNLSSKPSSRDVYPRQIDVYSPSRTVIGASGSVAGDRNDERGTDVAPKGTKGWERCASVSVRGTCGRVAGSSGSAKGTSCASRSRDHALTRQVHVVMSPVHVDDRRSHDVGTPGSARSRGPHDAGARAHGVPLGPHDVKRPSSGVICASERARGARSASSSRDHALMLSVHVDEPRGQFEVRRSCDVGSPGQALGRGPRRVRPRSHPRDTAGHDARSAWQGDRLGDHVHA